MTVLFRKIITSPTIRQTVYTISNTLYLVNMHLGKKRNDVRNKEYMYKSIPNNLMPEEITGYYPVNMNQRGE